MKVVIICWLVICTATGAAPAATTEEIRAGVSFDIPLAYVTPEGEAAGFFVDVFREAARREGLKMRVVVGRTGPDRYLESGQGDIWVAAVSTPERRGKFHVTRPWWLLDTYLAVMQSSRVENVQDVAGLHVLYPNQPPLSVPFEQALPGAQGVVENYVRTRFAALCAGRTDAVLFHETDVHRMLEEDEFRECKARGIRVIPFQQPVRQLSIIATREHGPSAERLWNQIESMKRDGTMAKLQSARAVGNELWRSQLEEEKRYANQRLWQVGLPFTAVLLAGGTVAYLRLRTAHQQVRRSLDASVEAARAKQEFLATMSHEIRTPMTAVLGASELLLLSRLENSQREYAETIHRSARGLLTLLNDVIDWSRIESGRFSVEVTPFDFGRLLDDVKANVIIAARAKGLALPFPVFRGTYKGDAGAIRQVLLNLLTNAVKFTDCGSVTVTAEELSRDAGQVRIRVEVTDTGVGISEKARKALFQRFQRGDAASLRRYQGSGLGLAISKELVERLGGVIGFESQPGKGSRFWFELPLEVAEEPLIALPVAEPTDRMPRLSILVVEDNHVNSLLIRRLLIRLGHEVEAAENGTQAVERVKTGKYDLVFMDCLMPEMDGFEATALLRKAGVQIPIIALTASALETDRRRCLDVGMNGFLTKPVLMTDLSLTIKKHACLPREEGS